MDWLDYIEFDPQDIAERFGEDALEALQEEVETLLQEIYDRLQFADSAEEIAEVEQDIQDFLFTDSEAETFAIDYEFEYLQEAMGAQYKSQDIVDRYLAIVGSPGSGSPRKKKKAAA